MFTIFYEIRKKNKVRFESGKILRKEKKHMLIFDFIIKEYRKTSNIIKIN